jgi:hypothetical protein
MIRAAMVVVALAGCGRSQGVDDRDLGGLVIAPPAHDQPIDVARAAKDPAELARALAMPHHVIASALGPHALSITTTTSVDDGSQRLNDLSDRASLELGDGATFHATYANSADYGREIVFSGGTLYLRPRYQRWHVRPPETPEEPEQLRDALYDAIAATWELVGFAASVSDQGTSQLAGRPVHTIGVSLASGQHSAPEEALAQRKWRESRKVQSLTGQVALDVAKGAPLAVKLDGTVTFERDGQHLTMHVSLDSSVANVGRAATIAVPIGDEIASTPERLREVDDRDLLLQGIAPPLRKEASK